MKRVWVDWTVRLAVEVPQDWSEDSIKFHVEEHLCATDLLDQLDLETVADENGRPCICWRSKVKLLHLDGSLNFSDMQGAMGCGC